MRQEVGLMEQAKAQVAAKKEVEKKGTEDEVVNNKVIQLAKRTVAVREETYKKGTEKATVVSTVEVKEEKTGVAMREEKVVEVNVEVEKEGGVTEVVRTEVKKEVQEGMKKGAVLKEEVEKGQVETVIQRAEL